MMESEIYRFHENTFPFKIHVMAKINLKQKKTSSEPVNLDQMVASIAIVLTFSTVTLFTHVMEFI